MPWRSGSPHARLRVHPPRGRFDEVVGLAGLLPLAGLPARGGHEQHGKQSAQHDAIGKLNCLSHDNTATANYHLQIRWVVRTVVVAVLPAHMPTAGLPLTSKVWVQVTPFEVEDCMRRASS